MRELQRKKANKIASACNFGKNNKAALMFQVSLHTNFRNNNILLIVVERRKNLFGGEQYLPDMPE